MAYRFPQDWPQTAQHLGYGFVEAVAYFRREAAWKIRTGGAENSRRKARAQAMAVRQVRQRAPAKWAEFVRELRAAVAELPKSGMRPVERVSP